MNRYSPTRARTCLAAVATIIFCGDPLPAAVELPASAKILDNNLIAYMRPVPTISPDGKLVAYVSRGFLCVADIDTGESRQLFEIRDSWTHVFATSPDSREGGDADSLVHTLGRDQYNELQARVKWQIAALQWTVDSDAIALGQQAYDAEAKTRLIQVWRVPLRGDARMIAHSTRPLDHDRGLGADCQLTRDQKHLVVRDYPRPLIWDLAANEPIATPFLSLTPSTTSGRWLAVEKDTRQLVVLDENFSVAKQFQEFVPRPPVGDHIQLHWSPDERHVIWRIQIGFDYYSHWEGCRVDLQTMQRRILTGSYMKEQIRFTGRGGEFLRMGGEGVRGQEWGLTPTSSYVQLVPQGASFPQDLWRKTASPSDHLAQQRLGGLDAVICSPDFDLFAIALPRQTDQIGTVFHLINRERRLWPLSQVDNGQYRSPYEVVGFAENGQTLIGYDETRLFAIPVAAIQTPENEIGPAAEAARRAAQRPKKPVPKFMPRRPSP